MNSEQICFPFVSCDEPPRRRAHFGFVAEAAGLELAEKPRTRGPVLNRPELVFSYLAPDLAWRPSQEKFYVLPVDRKNRALGKYLLSVGTLTSTCAAPREVYRIAIACAASAVICAHNHPSGDPAPSSADVQLTRLWEASHNRVYAKRPIMGTGPRRGSPVGRKQWPKAARYFP